MAQQRMTRLRRDKLSRQYTRFVHLTAGWSSVQDWIDSCLEKKDLENSLLWVERASSHCITTFGLFAPHKDIAMCMFFIHGGTLEKLSKYFSSDTALRCLVAYLRCVPNTVFTDYEVVVKTTDVCNEHYAIISGLPANAHRLVPVRIDPPPVNDTNEKDDDNA